MRQSNEQIIDGDFVEYGNGLRLDCRAVHETNMNMPFDFREYYDEQTAEEYATNWAHHVASTVLKDRATFDTPANIELPGIENVRNYVKRLGMQPVGRFSYVETMPEQKSSGVTDPYYRHSIVIKDKVDQDFSEMNWSEEVGEYFNNLRAGLVAVHELTHLAGSEDKVIFTVTSSMDRVGQILPTGSTLALPYVSRGGYFEEGLASLVASTYIWEQAPSIRELTKTVPYGTQSGAIVHVPLRNTYIGYQPRDICGWGIEQLTQVSPQLWDVLMKSRKYNASKRLSRMALRQCINHISQGLFDAIDRVDDDDIEGVIDVTERIGHIVSKHY